MDFGSDQDATLTTPPPAIGLDGRGKATWSAGPMSCGADCRVHGDLGAAPSVYGGPDVARHSGRYVAVADQSTVRGPPTYRARP